MPALGDRRRVQAGVTLVELLVAVSIAGLGLALVIGTLSTGLLDATLAKRNAAVQAVMQYETEQVGADAFSASTPSYSECFAIEHPGANPVTAAFQAACPNSQYSLRADVSWTWLAQSNTVQVWTIAVVDPWPATPNTISSVQVYKVAHR